MATKPAGESGANGSGGRSVQVATITKKRKDVRKARDRLGGQFDELRRALPRASGAELTAKAQVLEHSLSVIRELMKRATTLAVELAVVSPEATLNWIRDVSDDARRPFPETVSNAMKLFCWSRNWQYAEWWTLDEQKESDLPSFGSSESYTPDFTIESAVEPGSGVVAASIGERGDALENLDCCVVRDSMSVMRLARTLINTGSSDSPSSPVNQELAEFAKASSQYEFRPRVGMPGRVWTSRRAEWLPRLSDVETYIRSPLADRFGMKTCLAVPIVQGGQVQSVIAFYATVPRAYNATCYNLAMTLAQSLTTVYCPQIIPSDWALPL